MPSAKGLIKGAALIGAGVMAGIAAENSIVGRKYRSVVGGNVPYGSLRGTKLEVITPDGCELNVEVDEAPDAPDDLTIIFSHGYVLNQDTWHFQREALRGRARLIFADQRAHGKSGCGERSLNNIDQLGKDLGTIIDTVGGEGPIILVGHSMGGMTIMAAATERPDLFGGRVKGVALLGTAAAGVNETKLFKAVDRISSEKLNQRLLGNVNAVDKSRQDKNDLAYILYDVFSFGSAVPPSMVNHTVEMIVNTPITTVLDFRPSFSTHDKLAALKTIGQTDVLVMVGTKDRLTPVNLSRQMVEQMPNAEFVVLPDTGHMLMLERAEETNFALRQLMARVRRDN